MKSVLIIGLGRFGKYMAENMMALGNEVLAIDNREERVNEVFGDSHQRTDRRCHKRGIYRVPGRPEL